MPIEEITYHERKIVINTEGNVPQLTIDGEDIPLAHNPQTGEFIANRHSSYISFPSLLDLAKHLVDQVFNQRRD